MLFKLLGSFFLFVAFILELFVMIGQLSTKPFIRFIYFIQANNSRFNLSYGFALWSYCQGAYNARVRTCSHPIAAYNWYTTPGFDQMLPNLASRWQSVFLALFILYFIGLILSFLLWLMSLFLLCVPRRVLVPSMAAMTTLTFLIMLVALILALVLSIDGIKSISTATYYWSGHAGIALWFTIAAVFALLFAAACYMLSSCSGRRSDDSYYPSMSTVQPIQRPFDMKPHQSKPEQSPIYASHFANN